MQITLEIKCPTCLSDSIKKNGLKLYGKQKYYECIEVDEFWTFVGNKRINNYLFTLTIEKQERL